MWMDLQCFLRFSGGWEYIIALVLTYVVYQLFMHSGPVGRPAKHLLNQWVIHEVIEGVSPAASQAVKFIDSFMHSVHQLVTKQSSL